MHMYVMCVYICTIYVVYLANIKFDKLEQMGQIFSRFDEQDNIDVDWFIL